MSTNPSADPERGSETTFEGSHADPEKHGNDRPADSHSFDNDSNHAAEKAANDAQAPAPAATPPKNPMMDPSSFPDGGRQAWMTVLGAFCALFVSFGEFDLSSVQPNYLLIDYA